jgi:putative SOS response-associated peptidase YedK
MCGRFAFYSAAEAVHELFGVDDDSLSVRPQYNIAPTDAAAVVREDEHGVRRLSMLRWGLVPFWAKDPKIGARMINARAETVATKPAFRAAFRQRRCVVPADGYYEWHTAAGVKTPWYITRPDAAPLGFAGLWECWRDGDDGDPLETFTILTTASSGRIAGLHDRMPVILDDSLADAWLGQQGAPHMDEILGANVAGALTAWPVARTVNNARNEGEALIAPAGEQLA